MHIIRFFQIYPIHALATVIAGFLSYLLKNSLVWYNTSNLSLSDWNQIQILTRRYLRWDHISRDAASPTVEILLTQQNRRTNMASGINIVLFIFSDILNSYSRYLKKLFWISQNRYVF